MMDVNKFRSLLNDQINWPDHYTFKFVTKTESKDKLIEVLSGHQCSEKLSRNGKYTSVTSRKILNSADEVIEVYQKVSKVEGVISL